MIDPGATIMWIRTRDHAVVRTHGQLARIVIDVVHDEPCGKSACPLRVGARWSVECSSQATTKTPVGAAPAQETSMSRTYKVKSVESVTVAAGIFPAYKISYTETSGSTPTTGPMWYAAAASHHAKIVQASGGVTTTSERQSFTCANA